MPSDKKDKKRKKDRGDRDERRDRDRDDRRPRPKSSALEPADGGILAIFNKCFCVDLYPCCAKAERIDTSVDLRQTKRREREKREERRERRRRKEESERGPRNSYAKHQRQPSDDEGSERSYVSRAETDCSRASSARSYGVESSRSRGGASTRSRGGASTRSRGGESTRSRGGESNRNGRPERSKSFESVHNPGSPERDRRKPETGKPAGGAPTSGGGGDNGGIKVLNLSDLRGQELPSDIVHAGGKQGTATKTAVADDAKSEGGQSQRSARSTRSAAQSEGGQSVKSCASVSVRKYMGYLSEPKSPAEVKKLVKDFVRQMVKGRDLGVLCADGAMKPVVCSISRKLDTFKIKSGDQTRRVALSAVEGITHGNPDELSDLETPLDDSCSTMEIENGECISFKFAERKAAELFTLCMQLFVDGQKTQES